MKTHASLLHTFQRLLCAAYSSSTAVNDQIVHFYDRSLKICRITNIAEIIISRYGAKPNSTVVDVMEYDMRSIRTSIEKIGKSNDVLF